MTDRNIVLAGVLIILLKGVAGQALAFDDKTLITEIIENIRQNEEIYSNLEVETVRAYKVNPAAKHARFAYRHYKAHLHTVFQDDLFYLKRVGSGITMERKVGRDSELAGFDGTITRRVFGEDVVNLHRDRSEPSTAYRPHVSLISRGGVCVPLSLWLKGGEQLRAHPNAGLYSEGEVRVAYEGQEIVDGLQCLKLRCEWWDEGKEGLELNTLRFLWLSPERNYLPTKTESYAPFWAELLAGTGVAFDFREVKPGIWIAFSERTIAYCRLQAKEGKLVVSNTEERHVEAINLAPNYPIAFFRDIPIPRGAIVYEIRDGEIIAANSPDENVGEEIGGDQRVMMWFAAGFAIAVILLIWYWKRKWRVGAENRKSA